MGQTKLVAIFELKGGIMYSQEECIKDSHKTNHTTIMVDDGRRNKEIVHIFTRKCKPCTQTINMPKEAYEYFTGKEVPAFFVKEGNFRGAQYLWNKMGKKEKLKTYLESLAKEFKGKLVSYKVLDD